MTQSERCDKLLEQSAHAALFQCSGCHRTLTILCDAPLIAKVIECSACGDAMFSRRMPQRREH